MYEDISTEELCIKIQELIGGDDRDEVKRLIYTVLERAINNTPEPIRNKGKG